VLVVPRAAVLSPGGEPVVYLDKGGGAYEQRRVKLGRAGDDVWEVLGGLAEGERVVLNGNLLIDAQAQLNASASGSAPSVSPPAPPLTAAQQQAAREFLALVDAAVVALTEDKLAGFNAQSAKIHAALPALLDLLGQTTEWQPVLAKIEAAGHLPAAADLKAARAAFAPFSGAVAELVLRLERQAEFKELKVFFCPMAPKPGRWVQLQGPLINPFMGRASGMIDCGSEVKP
jgi:Cu(I)/Ag(I) efflux system membrane fusion protein